MGGNIYLIGYMCSGKTTLGRALACEMKRPFIDLDDAIEADAGMSLPAIFSKEGEEAFRLREADVLRRVALSPEPAIVACGGGTPCHSGNMEVMKASGFTVYLQPCKVRLLARLMDGRANRPLLASVNDENEMWRLAQRMIANRHPHYNKADMRFDSSLLETEEEISLSAKQLAAIVNTYGYN